MKKGNTFKQGISRRDHLGTNPMEDTGVPLQGFKGVPTYQGRGQFGVPIPGTGKQRKAESPKPKCSYITKKGEPCQAAPIRGKDVCIGHKRVKLWHG